MLGRLRKLLIQHGGRVQSKVAAVRACEDVCEKAVEVAPRMHDFPVGRCSGDENHQVPQRAEPDPFVLAAENAVTPRASLTEQPFGPFVVVDRYLPLHRVSDGKRLPLRLRRLLLRAVRVRALPRGDRA